MSDQTRFDRRKQRTRQQLQEAALALILERGFEKVSIQDITDKADVGRGTFYLHFRDKDEIVARIIHESFEAFEAQGAGMIPTSLTIEQRDYLSFIGFFAHIAQQGSLFNAVEGSAGAANVSAYIGEYVLKRAHLRLNEQNIFADVPPEIAAQFMTGALMQMVSWWLQHTHEYTPQQVAAMFFRLLHRKEPPAINFP